MAIIAPAAATGWLTYVVEVDGSGVPGLHPVEIRSTTSVDLTISSSVTSSLVPMGCTDMEATSANGAGVQSGTEVDEFVQLGVSDFAYCTVFGGMAWNVEADGGHIVRGMSLATGAAGDVIDVRVDDFYVEFRSVIPGLCNFDLTGTLRGEYREATSELVLDDSSFDGSLVVEHVVNSGRAFVHGDAASFGDDAGHLRRER